MEPLIFGPPVILLVLQTTKKFAPVLEERKWPIPLLALAASFALGFLMLDGRPDEIIVQCISAALGAMGLWSGGKALVRPLRSNRGSVACSLPVLLLIITSAACMLCGCATFIGREQPIDNLLTNIGEADKFGTQAVFDSTGAPVVIDGRLQTEARPGLEIEYWNNGYNDETNTFWSDNLVQAAATGMSAAVGFVDPWAGVAMLAANGLVNNLTLPATADVLIPEYFVGNRVRIRIGGKVVAAGGEAQGDAVTDSAGDFVGTSLEHRPYKWWAVFEGEMSDETREFLERFITENQLPEANGSGKSGERTNGR